MKTDTIPQTQLPEPVNTHYDQEYFDWQSEIGRFGGWANVSKFEKFVSPDTKVLDFGCGGGFLLGNLNSGEKLGIEINPVARAAAQKSGIRAVGSTSEVEDEWADLLISNHALEHCQFPLRELKDLIRKVVPGGHCRFLRALRIHQIQIRGRRSESSPLFLEPDVRGKSVRRSRIPRSRIEGLLACLAAQLHSASPAVTRRPMAV